VVQVQCSGAVFGCSVRVQVAPHALLLVGSGDRAVDSLAGGRSHCRTVVAALVLVSSLDLGTPDTLREMDQHNTRVRMRSNAFECDRIECGGSILGNCPYMVIIDMVVGAYRRDVVLF